MNLKPSVLSSIAIMLTFVGLLSGQAAPISKTAVRPAATAIPNAYPVFTVRYVVFVATPKKAMMPKEVKASVLTLPPVFDELQHGSVAAVMDTTPEGFANKLRRAQSDYKFQRLLSGSILCVNGSRKPAVINAGPEPSDPFQTTLNDSIFLEWNSPTTLMMRNTGKLVHTIAYAAFSSTGGPEWRDTWTDKAFIGRTYSQGIDNLSDGRRFIYAYCILPGNLDQTASTWRESKVQKMSRMTRDDRRVRP